MIHSPVVVWSMCKVLLFFMIILKNSNIYLQAGRTFGKKTDSINSLAKYLAEESFLLAEGESNIDESQFHEQI